MTTKLNIDILRSYPLAKLQNIDIKSAEEEKLVQEVLDEKRAALPVTIQYPRLLVPDIKNGEQEAEWQAKIDAYEASHRPLEVQIKAAETELEIVKAELEEVTAEPVVEPAPEAPVEPVAETVADTPEEAPVGIPEEVSIVETTEVFTGTPVETAPEEVVVTSTECPITFACEKCGWLGKTPTSLKAHITRFHSS